MTGQLPKPRRPRRGSTRYKALLLALERSVGGDKPEGKQGPGGKWRPSDAEKRPCCGPIRAPSHAFPRSLYDHCRTMKHLAERCGFEEVELQAFLDACRTDIAPGWLPDLKPRTRAHLAAAADQKVLHRLVGDPDDQVRRTVATRSTNARDLEVLAYDPDDQVCRAVASRSAGQRVLTALAQDPDDTVRRAVATYSTGEAVLKVLAYDRRPCPKRRCSEPARPRLRARYVAAG